MDRDSVIEVLDAIAKSGQALPLKLQGPLPPVPPGVREWRAQDPYTLLWNDIEDAFFKRRLLSHPETPASLKASYNAQVRLKKRAILLLQQLAKVPDPPYNVLSPRKPFRSYDQIRRGLEDLIEAAEFDADRIGRRLTEKSAIVTRLSIHVESAEITTPTDVLLLSLLAAYRSHVLMSDVWEPTFSSSPKTSKMDSFTAFVRAVTAIEDGEPGMKPDAIRMAYTRLKERRTST